MGISLHTKYKVPMKIYLERSKIFTMVENLKTYANSDVYSNNKELISKLYYGTVLLSIILAIKYERVFHKRYVRMKMKDLYELIINYLKNSKLPSRKSIVPQLRLKLHYQASASTEF